MYYFCNLVKFFKSTKIELGNLKEINVAQKLNKSFFKNVNFLKNKYI